MNRIAALAFLALGAPLASCGNDSPPTAQSTSAADRIPDGMVVRGPARGTDVAAAKKTAATGAEITLVGRIGGSEEPFSADRAVFTIVDPALKACSDMADPDHCKTPWDYCCEDRAAMVRGTATVEIAGADGRPLRVSARGVAGLEPLATVAVTGTVIERNEAGVLVVRAKRIEVR